MTQFEAFQKFIEDKKPTVKEVPATWPFNYNDNMGYEVTLDGLTQYFYFREDGYLLERKVLTNK